jgi:hypothetical protein
MVGDLMKAIPNTPMSKLYSKMQFKGAGKKGKSASGQRLDEARRMLKGNGARELVEEFEESILKADSYFSKDDRSCEPLYPKRKPFTRSPGLDSSPAFGRFLHQHRGNDWIVPGDESLNFRYVDRELVSTRAPGAKLVGKSTTAQGPRVDLLLANATSGRPILAELKLTTRGAPDKDPFYALIQALASAAYLLPPNQIKRLDKGVPGKSPIDESSNQVDLYLMIGREPKRSAHWFELRDSAEELARKIAPRIRKYVPTIAGLELYWDDDAKAQDKLIIKKWFSTAHS